MIGDLSGCLSTEMSLGPPLRVSVLRYLTRKPTRSGFTPNHKAGKKRIFEDIIIILTFLTGTDFPRMAIV